MQFRFDNDGRTLPESVAAAVKAHPVTATIVTLNVLVMLFQYVAYGGNDSLVLYRMGAKFGPAIQDGEWHRLVMPIMLHGGWMHLAVNNFGVLMVGPITERIYGSVNFAAIYLMAGIFGVVASYWNSPTLSVGASGALFGIVGATTVYFALNRKSLQQRERRTFVLLIVLIVSNLVMGELTAGIDQAAHVGGLIGGCLIAAVSSPRRALTVGRTMVEAHFESVRPEPIRVLLALIILGAISASIAWWVSATVTYGPLTMREYGTYLFLN